MRNPPLPVLLALVVVLALVAWFVGAGTGERPDAGSSGAIDDDGRGGDGIGLEGAGVGASELDPSDARLAATPELPPWPVGEPTTNEPGTGRVFVRLVDGNGASLPDFPIEVDWWKAFGIHGSNAGRTDADGRFQTEANAAFEIDSVGVPLANDDRANLLYHSGPFAAAPGRPDEVVVEVPATGRVRGRVVDLEGRPVSAKIQCDVHTALDLDPFLFRMRINGLDVDTDDDGRFELSLVAGRYEVSAEARGLPPDASATTRAIVTLDARRRVVYLELVVAFPLRGRSLEVFVAGVEGKIGVTARTEAPVLGLPQASEGIVHSVERQLRHSRHVAPGHYQIDNVFGDPWTVFVWVPGSGMVERPVPSGATRLEVELAPAPAQPKPNRTVRVVARLPDGSTVRPTVQPYRGLTLLGGGVSMGPRDDVEGEPVTFRGTDSYRLVLSYRDMAYAGVGPLDVTSLPDRIEVPLEEASHARVELVDTAGRPVAATFELSPPWSFFRRVLPSGATEPGTQDGYAPVVLDLHRASSERGVATFRTLGSTPFRVFARPENGELPPARGVVRGGETLTLTVGSGLSERVSLSGRLFDAHTGRPIEGARVEVFTVEHQLESGSAQNVSGPEGRFVLTGLPAVPTEVRVFARGYALPRLEPVDLGVLEGPLDLRLDPARRVPLRVLDAKGQPFAGAVVMVRDAEGRYVVVQDQYGNYDGEEGYTDLAGRVDLLGIPAGPVVIEVTTGYAQEPETFEVDAYEPFARLVTLQLPR